MCRDLLDRCAPGQPCARIPPSRCPTRCLPVAFEPSLRLGQERLRRREAWHELLLTAGSEIRLSAGTLRAARRGEHRDASSEIGFALLDSARPNSGGGTT